ncbi:MAG: NAD(P)/FAD-dependent oxidoreductase [bacterium]|nr:NAD(P)/FAD-dependent oxidoreductase [bacterium]
MTKKIIKIAGAGIAGLTAAINLAKADYKVEIYERSDVSGKRFHGDFQGIENWSFKKNALDFLKQANIEINFDCTDLTNVSAWGPDDFQQTYQLSRPVLYLVKRGVEKGCLDYGLQQQISNYKNIKILYNKPVKTSEVDIVATGPFRKDPYTNVLAGGYTFNTNIKDCGILIFDDECAPDGYSYFLVHNHYGVIATCFFEKFNQLSEFRDKTLALCQKHIKFEMHNIKEFSGIGNFFLSKIPTDKKIYIGEAGGVQDYLWGFGMRYAVLTGYLAAKSIIEDKDYYAMYQKQILPKLKVSISNRLTFKLMGKRGYRAFINRFTKSEDPVNELGRLYNPSLPKTLLYPIARAVYQKHVKDPRKLD